MDIKASKTGLLI